MRAKGYGLTIAIHALRLPGRHRRYSTSTRESARSMAAAGCIPALKERNHTRFTGLNLFSDVFLGTTAKTRMAF
jgi:hypothetical protein